MSVSAPKCAQCQDWPCVCEAVFSKAPKLYVLSTDPARRPIAFVSEPEPCKHLRARALVCGEGNFVASYCDACGALNETCWFDGWQMPGRAR